MLSDLAFTEIIFQIARTVPEILNVTDARHVILRV